MLARLLVSARLVPGMFCLAWRLIRVRLCLASAWPIRLGMVRARAVIVFAVRGAFHKLGGTHLNFVRVADCAMSFLKLDGTLLVCSVRGAASATLFLVTPVCPFTCGSRFEL